jgi:hypothetical protein
LQREGILLVLFFKGQFGAGAVNEVRAKNGLKRELPAGLWADGVNSTGLFIRISRHNKGAGSSLACFRNPGFTVFVEAAIVFLDDIINGVAEKASDFADSLGVERKPYLGATFAAPLALKMLPLGVGMHSLTLSVISYVQTVTDCNCFQSGAQGKFYSFSVETPFFGEAKYD